MHQPRHQVLFLLKILVVHLSPGRDSALGILHEHLDETEERLHLRDVGDFRLGAKHGSNNGGRHLTHVHRLKQGHDLRVAR